MTGTLPNTTMTILAGGQGARFWPISRMQRPKQFLSICASGESLIAATVRRIEPLVGKENVLIMTNVLHEELIREHVPNAEVVCEPLSRNTAASIGLAAIYCRKKDPNRIMVSLPADHAVQDEENLRKTLADAVQLATAEDVLVTVGIRPTRPDTAYGYIKVGTEIGSSAFRVARFFEKPSFERAGEYLESGDFFWNSGMFAWRCEIFLKAVEDFMPDLYAGLCQIDEALGSGQEKSVIQKVFAELESISVDFGILEHARNCAVVVAHPYGWNDVGSWDAWAEHFETDQEGNLLHGDALAIDSKDCVLYSADRMIAVLGAEDIVVIDAGDAVMVCPRDKVQDVRKIVDELKKQGRKDLI